MPEIGPEELRQQIEKQVAEETKQRPSTSEPYSASVTMNIDPSAVPLRTADWSKVLLLMNAEFMSRYDASEIESLIPPEARRGPIEPESLIQVALNNDRMIAFQGGRLQYQGSDTITSIEKVAVASQTLHATVSGSTLEATYLCQAACLIFWQSVGINRKWNELKHYVNITTYRTTTVEDLGVSMLDFLAPEVRSFIARDIQESEHALGRSMGVLATPEPQLVKIIPYCREIDLRITVVDEVSGESDECILNFLLDRRNEANRTKMKVSSELSSEKHTTMVNKLRENFAAGKKTPKRIQ